MHDLFWVPWIYSCLYKPCTTMWKSPFFHKRVWKYLTFNRLWSFATSMKLDLTSEQGIYGRNYNILNNWYNLDFLGKIENISFGYIYIYFVLPLRQKNRIYWGSKYAVDFAELYMFNTSWVAVTPLSWPCFDRWSVVFYRKHCTKCMGTDG